MINKETTQSEKDIDTLDLDDEIKQVRAELALKQRTRLVLGGVVCTLVFITVCMLLSSNEAGARLVVLFTLMFGSIWAVNEIVALRNTSRE